MVPGLIDAGIDVLQALQFSAKGMDPGVLKDRFGDRLCFEGGVSVQTTLPFGTVKDVRAEVEHLSADLLALRPKRRTVALGTVVADGVRVHLDAAASKPSSRS